MCARKPPSFLALSRASIDSQFVWLSFRTLRASCDVKSGIIPGCIWFADSFAFRELCCSTFLVPGVSAVFHRWRCRLLVVPASQLLSYRTSLWLASFSVGEVLHALLFCCDFPNPLQNKLSYHSFFFLNFETLIYSNVITIMVQSTAGYKFHFYAFLQRSTTLRKTSP